MKKSIVVIVVSCACALRALSQPHVQQETNVIAQRGLVQVLPLYQRWSSDNSAFYEGSSVLSWYQPVSGNASISARGAFASAGGDVANLNGLTDVQLSGNYYLEPANLVLSLAVGIPTGKTGLTTDEFSTSVLLSHNIFRFQVPHFGTGFNLSPGVVWALPVNDALVLGAGASYQYRGAFDPFDYNGTYTPGGEIAATAGLDARVDETSSISGDVTFTYFTQDKFDDQVVFRSGNRVLAVIQYRKYFKMDQLYLYATYRTRGKADIPFSNPLAPSNERVEPDQIEVMGVYTAQFTGRVTVGFLLEGRFFQQTNAPLSGFNLVGVGANPQITISENLSTPIRLRYIYGSGPGGSRLSGLEAGAGVAYCY